MKSIEFKALNVTLQVSRVFTHKHKDWKQQVLYSQHLIFFETYKKAQ